MPNETHYPGVYVEELPSGPRSIAGVPTSVALFIGIAPQGTAGRAIRIRSAVDVHREVGPPGPGNLLGASLLDFLDNGGRDAWALCVSGDATLTPASPAYLAALDLLLETDGLVAQVEHFNLLVAPGLTHVPTIVRLQALCRERFAFLLLDAPSGADQAAVVAHAQALSAGPDASYSALYDPWVQVSDPVAPGVPRLAPPSGLVAGVYARIDEAVGVWKAPAGLTATLAGVTGMARVIDDSAQDVLNPMGVNALRQFPQYGPVIWGARTLDTRLVEVRYVPVRRTLMFIEDSVSSGLQWAVFERNDEALWAAVRNSVQQFLLDLWRQGALYGASLEQACFVACGRGTTMTDADVAAGQLRVEVGVALVLPAEFIVVNIALATAGP